MNITIITELLPWPLNSGGAQGQFNMIDQLRKLHHITLIFQENGYNKLSAKRILEEKWPDVKILAFPYWRQLCHPQFLLDKIERAFKLKFTPKSQRFLVQRILKPYGVCYSSQFLRFVNRVIKENNTDIIQVEFYPCLHLVNFLPSDIKKVFVHHELRFVRNDRMTKPLQLMPKEEELKKNVKETELGDLNKYDAIITVTRQDQDYLLREGITKPIYSSPSAIQTTPQPYQEWNGKLSFVGGYFHSPNQEGIDWYLKEVVPFLGEDSPILEIIGKGWPDDYKSPHCFPKGFVSCLSDVISGSIMIVPILSGSGMRMKILEAMAMSLPIVTTTVGVEGIKLTHNESCIIADTPEEFSNAIREIASNPELHRRLGVKANEVFRQRYSVEKLSSVRNDIYKAL